MSSRKNGAAGPKGELWRRLAHLGASRGPRAWLELSPPFFGLAFALALPEQRRRVRANLCRVLGPRSALEEHWDVARTFASYASCLAEALAAERPEVLAARRRFRNPERIESVLHSGRGVVIGTAHFGAWDVAAPLLARDLGAPVLVAMHPEEDAAARGLHDEIRRRAGVRVVHVGTHALDALPLLRHLRDGGVVAIQLDRAVNGSRTLDATLFGHRFGVPEGPFRLAALARVPLLPLFVRRRAHLDYELSAGSPIELPEQPTRAELEQAGQRAADEMARAIYACPTQWFHFEAD